MRYILFVFGFSFLFSCKAQVREVLPKLEGEWIYCFKDEIQPREIGIKFSNDTLFEMRQDCNLVVGRYVVDNDEIKVIDSDSTYLFYQIQKFGSDSLFISNSNVIWKYYNRQLDFNNSLTFDRIFIKNRQSDEFAEFEIEIDRSTKILKFNGLRNCERLGRFEVIIDDNKVFKLDSIFKFSKIDILEMTRDHSAEYDWEILMEINYNKDFFKTINGSYRTLPYQIKPVIQYLFSLAHKNGLL